MSHSQFRPMYLLTTNGSQQYFVPQTIPAINRVSGDNVIQTQYYYHSLPPRSFAQPYSTYQPNHSPANDANDVQLPRDSTLPDGAVYPDMSTVPFSPPLTPQLPEQLEQQPPYIQSCAKRHSSAVAIIDPQTLQRVNVDDDTSAVAIINPQTLQEVKVDDDTDPNDTSVVAIVNPQTLQEVNVDDDTDPNNEHSVKSKETVDNTWMIVEDITIALNNLKEGFDKFRDQVTKDIEELRNQNYQFQNQVTKVIEELRDQVIKNQEELLDLKGLISASNVSKFMVSKYSEIDSFEKFCVFAREAELPCEPEDYEEFKYNKERIIEMNTRLHRKLRSL